MSPQEPPKTLTSQEVIYGDVVCQALRIMQAVRYNAQPDTLEAAVQHIRSAAVGLQDPAIEQCAANICRALVALNQAPKPELTEASPL